MFQKHTLFSLIIPFLLIALAATACGSASTASNGGSTPSATTVPTTAPTTTASSTVSTASATVQGKSATILTNAKGLTLYYRTSDTATSVCSGGCAQAWPPLIFSGSGSPTSASALPGKLSVSTNANGAQVEYQGHPLYTFASDSAAGQTNGEGVGGVWFVATTDLKAVNSATPGATPTSNGYGNGGY